MSQLRQSNHCQVLFCPLVEEELMTYIDAYVYVTHCIAKHPAETFTKEVFIIATQMIARYYLDDCSLLFGRLLC